MIHELGIEKDMILPPHISVLLPEFLKSFEDITIHRFLDGTLGAGGHAEALLKAHPEVELFFGMDQDPMALEIATKRLVRWSDKLRVINDNFSHFDRHLKGDELLDGMLFDLGVSSM